MNRLHLKFSVFEDGYPRNFSQFNENQVYQVRSRNEESGDEKRQTFINWNRDFLVKRYELLKKTKFIKNNGHCLYEPKCKQQMEIKT